MILTGLRSHPLTLCLRHCLALPALCLTSALAEVPRHPPADAGGGGNAPRSAARTAPTGADPTKASPRLKAALNLNGSAIPPMVLGGVVLGGTGTGVVYLEIGGGNRLLARPGVPFAALSDGELHKLVVNSISADGVEIEAPEQKEKVMFGGSASGLERSGVAGTVDYVEFHDVTLLVALQMLSDQTGANYSASMEANKVPINVMLRHVPVGAVVEEICKSNNLWFRRDESTGITRIMTVAEFEKDLTGFHEEHTEVFTLKYPNVAEISNAIADLFGDRVQLAPGSGTIQDDESLRDLGSRFDRFEMLTQRTETANSTSNGSNTVGNGVNGFSGNGGNSSSFSTGYNRGYGNSGYGGGVNGFGTTQRNTRNTRRTTDNTQAEDDLFRNLTPDQASRVQQALTEPGANPETMSRVENLRKRQATIYVTASKRNNMVVVRTADLRAMEDIRALVIRMDVQTPLVLLEVKVVQIQLGKEFRSAFDYQFGDGSTGASFSRQNVAQPLTGGVLGTGGLNSSDMTFTIVNKNFRAQMQMFEEKDRVKTLATPLLLTANNEISRLFLGEERPLVRGVSSQTLITDNNVATTPNTTTEFRNVGDTLLITPNINSDRTVTLRLVQENSSISPNQATIPVVTGGTSSTVQNIPVDVVATRSVSGTFVAKDGMAVAIGGMIQDVDSDKRGQVPVLGSIPVLGNLFRRVDKNKSRTELVVIIRPRVMMTPADSESLTKDLVQKLAPSSMELLEKNGFFPPAAQAVPSGKSPAKVAPARMSPFGTRR